MIACLLRLLPVGGLVVALLYQPRTERSAVTFDGLSEEESTTTVMTAPREVVESKGLFCALYSDRGSHFWLTPKVGSKVHPHRLTQVGRTLRELGTQLIPAYSPQARGRRERYGGGV